MNVAVPDNVLLRGWLPAHKVNPMADLSIIHGGQGTVYTTCLAGAPIVGIAFQPEQEGNLQCLVRKGFAIRVKWPELTPEKILVAAWIPLADEAAQGNRVQEDPRVLGRPEGGGQVPAGEVQELNLVLRHDRASSCCGIEWLGDSNMTGHHTELSGSWPMYRDNNERTHAELTHWPVAALHRPFRRASAPVKPG